LEGEGKLLVQEEGIQVLSDYGNPLFIPYYRLDWLSKDDYSLTLGLEKEGKVELSRLGAKREEAARLIEEGFQRASWRALFLGDKDLKGIFELKIQNKDFSENGTAAVFPSILILFAGTGGIRVLPMRYLRKIAWNEQTYSITLETSQGTFSLSQLGMQTDKFLRALKSSLEESRTLFTQTLTEYLPGIEPFLGQKLNAILWERGALKKSQVDDERLWEKMVSLIQEEKKEYIESLFKMVSPEKAYFGITPSPFWESELPYLSWFSAVLYGSLVFEVSSKEEGFATYLFRVPATSLNEAEEWVKEVHIWWPLLGFHREIIFFSEEELESEANRSLYLLLKLLPVVHQMRENFLGKVVHSEPEKWEKEIRRLASKA
jgi:hypothetical protein